MTCSRVTPSGMFFPITPEKIVSVAQPSTLGANTLSATEIAPATNTMISRVRSSRRFFSSLRSDGPKEIAFSGAAMP